jgi:hypothetical protein
MDIVELGAIGELVGGVAVVGSLIYLALQVRQSNDVAKAESVRELTTEMGRISMKTCDPELAVVLRRAIVDFGALPKNDQLVAAGWLGGLFTCAQAVHASRSSSRPSKIEQWCASWVAGTGLTAWWEAGKVNYSRRFADEIDRLVAAGAPPVVDINPWFGPDPSESRTV